MNQQIHQQPTPTPTDLVFMIGEKDIEIRMLRQQIAEYEQGIALAHQTIQELKEKYEPEPEEKDEEEKPEGGVENDES